MAACGRECYLLPRACETGVVWLRREVLLYRECGMRPFAQKTLLVVLFEGDVAALDPGGNCSV